MAGKKGDLEITIIEARNCGVRGHALYCSVELKTQKTSNQKAYYTNAAKDAKWNQTFSLDLMSLDGEELLIQLFCKRNVKKDKFLGQSQMRISALNLSKEAEWHFLNDKPESELKSADTLKRSMSMSVVGNKGSSVKKKDMYIVSGEILYKLNFVHRLIRAKSKAAIHKEVPPLSPPLDSLSSSLSPSPSPLSARGSESSPSIRLSVPSVSPRTYTDFQKSHEAATEEKSTASNRRIGPNDNNAKEETSEISLSLQKSTPPDESPVDLSITEEVIIDEALKEKQKMVKEKLEQGAKLVRHMTSRIIKLEKDEGEAAVRDDKNQLEQIKKNMSELEKILEATEAEPNTPLTHTTSARSLSRGDRDVRVNPDSVNATSSTSSSSVGNSNSKSSSGLVASASRPNIGREPSLSVSEGSRSHLSHSQAATTPVVPIRKHSDAPRPNGIQRGNAAIYLAPNSSSSSSSSSVSASISASWTPSAATLASSRPTGIKIDNNNNNNISLSENFANIAEETKFLRVKVKFLEKNIESLQSNNNTLEKEVSRLEKELDRYQREEKLRIMEEKIREREERVIAWEREIQSRAGGRSSIVLPPSESDMFELPEEAMDDQQKAIQTKLKTLDAEIRTGTLRKNNLKAEAMKNAVKFKEEVLKKLNREAQKYEAKINQKIPDTDSNDESEIDSSTDDDMSDDVDGGATTPNRVRSPNLRDAPQNDAKYDALVAKLEKLDKLDELMRKLDNIKMVAGASGADGGDGRGYAELKAELEQIQAIIFDETGKYTEKEKEDANIKYEKVSQEFQQTDEYKKEVAAALEEKRKLNEPLNKAALEKMVKVYNTNSIRDDPVIKDKAQKNPELTLIGMDPKAILSKHQNDFQQYMLRNLTLDELRAIRASLPKFRNDQKRQIDWVESLEQKIELVSKEPPKKAPAVKKAPIKLKPKTGGGGDFMAELMARQKREAAERGEVVEEEKKEVQKPAALKLGPKPVAPTPPPVNPPPPPPKLSGAPPPPPPPPRV